MNKKLLFLFLFSCLSNFMFAQNPDNWSKDGDGIEWNQETTTINSGTYSVGITWTSTSNQFLNSEPITVTEGSTINASFSVFDNDAAGRARLCIIYTGASNVYDAYSVDGTSWQTLSFSDVVPTGATEAILQIRLYDYGSWEGSATVYIDDVSVTLDGGSNLILNPGFETWTTPAFVAISSAYSISSDAIDVIYESSVSSVDPTDYLLSGSADITFSTATIDATDDKIVHLSGASTPVVADAKSDSITDANSKAYLYAGISPIALTNKANPLATLSQDTVATFQGIISANDEYESVWIADAAGAYNGVLIYSKSFYTEVNVGDEVLISAQLDEYNNLTELVSPKLISVVSSGNTPYGPSIISGSTIAQSLPANSSAAESWEGQLVKIVNATITGAKDGTDYFYPATDDNGATAFRIGDNVDFRLYNIDLTLNNQITITGVVDYADGTYRINPRNMLDIVSSSDTVTSSEYTINNSAETITNVPYSTSLSVFKSNITACDTATFEIYDADGTTPATVLDDTKLLKVVAADGITTKTYAITRNSASTVASVTSSVYTVNDVDETITDVSYGTELATFESNITPPEYGSFETYESDGSTVATDLQTGYILTGTAEDGTTTKSYTITLNTSSFDKDSYAQAPTTQIEADTVVVAESNGRDESFPVFSFDIVDSGSDDLEPTRVSQIIIYLGPDNTADIENDIDSGYFAVNGTPVGFFGIPEIGEDSVAFAFADDEIVVPNGGSVNVSVFVNLDSNATEGNVIQFMIPAENHGFEAYPSGSEFVSSLSDNIVGNKITIDVVATELEFVQQPSSVFVNDTIKPAVTIQAIDEYGNIDKDFDKDITVTSSGASLLYSPHVVTPVNGVAIFDTLVFSNPGNEVILSAVSAPLPLIGSESFVVAEESDLDLYFSEYIDGTSNNKALEIYNPTGLSINLKNYLIKGTSNGATDWKYEYTFPDTAQIQPNDVFCIVHSSASEEMKEKGDWITGGFILGYNGNDARGLFKIVEEDTILIDLLGTPNNPEGKYYSVAGIEEAMDENTLIRKPTINAGNTDWAASAGTNADDSEWLVYDIDYIDDLGKRSLGGSNETEILTFTIPGMTIDTATKIIADNDSIAITVVYSAQLDSLFPQFTLSAGATSEPESGDSVDFSSGKADIVVTAEDGTTKQTWTVYVVEQLSEVQTGNDIIGLELTDQVGSAVIDTDNHIATAFVLYGTDLTKIVPAITLSAGAISIPASGDTIDFSDTVSMTITAENGDVAEWKVVVKESIIEVPNLADARALYGSTAAIKITGEVVLTAQTDFKNKKYFQDATAGIAIIDDAGAITSEYSIGDGITSLTGTLEDYNGVLQLRPVANPGNATSTGNSIEPQVITIAELKTNFESYESELIKIEGSKFKDSGDDFANGKNYDIFLNSDTVICRTDFYNTDLTGTEIPDSADITGIAAEYKGDYEIFPRFLADVETLGEPSSNANLSDLKVDGTTVSGFNPAFLSYNIDLPVGTTTTPVVTYTTSDENATAVVENATDVTGDEGARTTKVVVTAEDGTTTRTYGILFEVKTSGLDKTELSNITVYPNPAHSKLVVNNTSTFESIKILNVTGKQITAISVNDRTSVSIDVSELQNGLYIVQLRSGDAIRNLKFVKK